MKKKFAFFLLFFSFCLGGVGKAYPNYVEVDLEKRNIKLANISLDGQQLLADISYEVGQRAKASLFFIQGKNLSLGGKNIEGFKIKAAKKGDILFIDKIEASRFSGSGTVDLKEEKILFNFSGNWQEDAEYLKGEVNLEVKIWGGLSNFLVSGNFVVLDGAYEGIPFKKLRCSFLGTLPVFNVTDAEVILDDGSVFELKGDLDIRDPKNFFPGVEFVSQKLFIDGWQVFGAQEEVGLRKKLDDKFNVEIDSEESRAAGTEFRYSLENDNFLKLRMQEEETILGIEKRREF